MEHEADKCIFQFSATGTQWEIETKEPINMKLMHKILKRIEQFDRVYSRFRSDSLIYQMASSHNGDCFHFPEDSIALFDLYDKLHEITRGAVNPLVGRQLELLGYDSSYTMIPSSEAYEGKRMNWSSIAREGTTLCSEGPAVIDVGAAGKGHLVDIVSNLLKEAGYDEFVVDGSGDLYHHGKSSLRVGLEHPLNPEMVVGIAHVKNGSICASASNRRVWGDQLHHILDARTGVPVNEVVATWVIAETALLADGLATGLFFADGASLLEISPYSYVRMFADGRAEKSFNFDGDLFT